MQVLKNKRKHNDELFNGIPIRVLVYTTYCTCTIIRDVDEI
jgi:hypothetical protein